MTYWTSNSITIVGNFKAMTHQETIRRRSPPTFKHVVRSWGIVANQFGCLTQKTSGHSLARNQTNHEVERLAMIHKLMLFSF